MAKARRSGGGRRASGTRRARKVAREALGLDSLRPGQAEAMEAVARGRDTLVVMPTGSGKTAIYQVAGHIRPGPTVVVSPLIALQRDQLESLDEGEAGEAASVDSTRSATEVREAFDDLEDDELEFLLLSPEQLAKEDVLERVRRAEPSLLVVDEAHCISEWGHDFRPDYLRLREVVEALGHPTVLAMTATAAPPVREEIVERLGMRDAAVVVRGFDRPNIYLEVRAFHEDDEKTEALVGWVVGARGPGIVYAATRKRTEELAERLGDGGVRARAYHAGMAAGAREDVQQAFMEDRLDAVVATTAFGMGIDKSNVRYVAHHDVSESLDAYFQEIGRAGRDGERAEAVLFYRPEDLGLRRFFAGGAKQVPGDLSPEEAEAARERRRRFERSRIEMIRRYAETRACRRRFLLSYFGETGADRCGFCDNCESGAADDEPEGGPFGLGARVEHPEWGRGSVLGYEGEAVVVLFDQEGYRTLAVDLVEERGLLRPAG